MAPEIAIIGAGLGGLSAAYGLKTHGLAAELFEADSRAGGRVRTFYDLNSDGQFAELGGEAIDSGDSALMGLARSLGLKLDRLDGLDSGLTQESFFYGNRLYTQEEIAKLLAPLFNKTRRLYARIQKSQSLFEKYDRMTLREYLEGEQEHLESWLIRLVDTWYVGFLGKDSDSVSSFSFICQIGNAPKGFSSLGGESDGAFRISGGSERLIKSLLSSLGPDSAPNYEHRLVSIKDLGGSFRLEFDTPGGIIERNPRILILALPISCLRSVAGISKLELSLRKKFLISNLGYATNSKLVMGSRSAFWRQGADSRMPNSGEIQGDFPSQSFWQACASQPGSSALLTNYVGGEAGRLLEKCNYDLALRDLKRIYPLASSQFTGLRASMNWSKQPFALGSYSCTLPGQHTGFNRTAEETELGGRLIFAGEHASIKFQASMNGACSSGLLAAARIAKSVGARVISIPESVRVHT